MTNFTPDNNDLEQIKTPDKKQEVINALKEGKENAQELLRALIMEKENEVKKSADPATAAIELNVYRARLYFEVGTDDALAESLNDYEDAIEQALNEGKEELANQIMSERTKYFGEWN